MREREDTKGDLEGRSIPLNRMSPEACFRYWQRTLSERKTRCWNPAMSAGTEGAFLLIAQMGLLFLFSLLRKDTLYNLPSQKWWLLFLTSNLHKYLLVVGQNLAWSWSFYFYFNSPCRVIKYLSRFEHNFNSYCQISYRGKNLSHILNIFEQLYKETND